ncbi:MAG TPA: NYN domain-containing protein [Chloroflexota bacterium]|nr:NYN domain-containing protein [Chloroflexota bacterium]
MNLSPSPIIPDAALLIDWDNLKAGLKSMGRQPNISSLLDAVNQRGRVVIARAYADWQQRVNAFDPPNLYAAGIEPVYVPVRMLGGRILKNSADVKLAVDCIDFLNTAAHLQTFFLVSGDSDLVHLVNFLRARGKRVVVIAVSGTLSQMLAENVDELLMYDVDIDPVRQPEPPANGRKAKATPESARLDEAFDALADLLRNRSNRVGSLFSWIGIQLGRRGFDHRSLGFERFKDFMQEAERRGKVRILTRGLQDWAYLPEQYDDMTKVEAEEEEEEANGDEAELRPTAVVASLAEEDQRNFVRYLADLEARSEYLIPPYIASHLVRQSVLPSLSQTQIRSLVRDAIQEEILIPSTHVVAHRATGKPYELRTVKLNADHPLVQAVFAETAA